MPAIDSHADVIHPLDDPDSKFADAVVMPFEGAVADQRSIIVGQLARSLPETMEGIDVVRLAEMRRVLKPKQNPVTARRFRAQERNRPTKAENREGRRAMILSGLLLVAARGE